MKLLVPAIIMILCTSCRQQNNLVALAAKAEKPVVVLQPFTGFPSTKLQWLKDSIEHFYPVVVQVNKEISPPPHAYYRPRNRYKADTIIHFLLVKKAENARTIVGVMAQDISTTKNNVADYGIMGLGFLPGKSCVVSSFRLIGNTKDEYKKDERLYKTVIHEMGHNFGLPHCNDKHCFMADAEGKMQQDEEHYLCKNCKDKLKI